MSKTYDAIMDYLVQSLEILPATINSPKVEWIWTAPNGHQYGITNGQAQSITIIAERCGEHMQGGYLHHVKGCRFGNCSDFPL